MFQWTRILSQEKNPCFGSKMAFPANIYLFKIKNRNTKKRCDVCSKLTVKTLDRHHRRRSSDFVVNFEHISHLFSSVSIVDFEQVNISWVTSMKRLVKQIFMKFQVTKKLFL